MIARARSNARSGITLTEILISILIMGIGLISLATLFPLGLIRLRDASRFHRGGMLAQSATDDLDARSLLYSISFTRTWYGTVSPFTSDAVIGSYKSPVNTATLSSTSTLFQPDQPGLPVCYDPLWRAVTNIVPPNNALFDGNLDFKAAYSAGSAEARFGCGVVIDNTGATFNPFNLRTGPSDTSVPSAYGLQRITNFVPWSGNGATPLYPFTYTNPSIAGAQPIDVAGDTFTSIDDLVFNPTNAGISAPSPLLPDFGLGAGQRPVSDWRYTWFFTGRQIDSTNNTMFIGDVVVCDGRPFGFEPLVDATGKVSPPVATGETVVEAIFGFSTNVNATTGFANGADRTVLLRWPASIPDPQVRVGGWIADVTYERDNATSGTKTKATNTPFQRCYWYQVVKRTDGENETASSTGPNSTSPGYRRMLLTVSSQVRAKTQLGAGGVPSYLNVALVMPSVINVYGRSFTIH